MSNQVNITIGTAGHIDHGKTSLVKMLTGCDTDYLKEEKERGMSIELGFAPCLVSGMQVGIVDVPGHENFIKTMVAGASSMDAVLLVVAADDGVMPQTREHLDILTLLGIKKGMIVLTKCDKVHCDELELVSGRVRQYLAGTFLWAAPIVPVSNVTGQGFDVFLEVFKKLVAGIECKKTDGLFRMPVEKVFSVKGYGTVITGIPVSGSAKTGDEIILMPQNIRGRIKTIQVYNDASDNVLAGQCAAANIPQISHTAVKRGNVLVADECFGGETLFICNFEMLPAQKQIKNAQQVKFHTGTSDVTATVFLLEGPALLDGRSSLAQVRLDRPIVAAPGDRFILRSLTPPQTIGGGRIITSAKSRIKPSQIQALAGFKRLAAVINDMRSYVEISVAAAWPQCLSTAQVIHTAKLQASEVKTVLAQLADAGKILSMGQDRWSHSDSIVRTKQLVLDELGAMHKADPQKVGFEAETLLNCTGLEKHFLESTLTALQSSGDIKTTGRLYSLAAYCPSLNPELRNKLDMIELLFKTRLFDPPDPADIINLKRLAEPELMRLLKMLLDQGILIAVQKELYFHKDAIRQAKKLIENYISKNGGLESVQFKYLLNTTRKYAIPLLDYFDRVGFTKRSGYTRMMC
ncbi:MAG: selenocysteine-specific translation elongation factor [Planctomycetes bacterium GWF2_50_10]|nr:MAG: selenocysteine-specific translation elongation factor [Planctomycetes bacterium GWF2_50_10]